MINAYGNELRNTYPLVFIYGFMGYELDSFISFPYWGGFTDLRAELMKQGFRVHCPEIGPISSNWDRACELYAALKGGRVDYGAAHAARYGHARYGREYPGLIPELGEGDPESGEIGKAHLIGHSMGAQTARLLAYLWAYGAPEEQAAAGSDCSPLFTGGRLPILSITSLSTPHNGTTLTANYESVGGLERLFIRWFAARNVRREKRFIDLMLDHWAPRAERAGMRLDEYIGQVVRNEQWSGFEDLALYDISPAGAVELNRRTAALPQTYYFSWGTSRTVQEGPDKEHLPAAGMHRPLQSGARFMGSLRDLPPGAEGPPERWWENDGVVNTCSMDGPRAGSTDTIRRYDGHPKRGCWNFMGVLHPLDHWQVHLRMMLGDEAPPGCESLLDYYSRMAHFLCSLPPEETMQPLPRAAPQGS